VPGTPKRVTRSRVTERWDL